MLSEPLDAERILPAPMRDRPPPVRAALRNGARLAGFDPTDRFLLPTGAIPWGAWDVPGRMVSWQEARRARAASALAEFAAGR